MTEPVSLDRIIALVSDLGEPHIEIGPLDRDDLRNLLCELLERRNGTITASTVRGDA